MMFYSVSFDFTIMGLVFLTVEYDLSFSSFWLTVSFDKEVFGSLLFLLF
jgi:hypothetical protein